MPKAGKRKASIDLKAREIVDDTVFMPVNERNLVARVPASEEDDTIELQRAIELSLADPSKAPHIDTDDQASLKRKQSSKKSKKRATLFELADSEIPGLFNLISNGSSVISAHSLKKLSSTLGQDMTHQQATAMMQFVRSRGFSMSNNISLDEFGSIVQYFK